MLVGILTIMQEIKVKNVIIGKQFEDSENYQKFLEIVKKRKINVKVVHEGNRIDIEKNLYFDVLWPSYDNVVTENILNNNSLVCKLVYKNFSMMFTGDIEEIAEKTILKKYKNNLEILKSTVLKVAHHGSKTSTTEFILEEINPKIALIGVGKNNLFKHPSDQILENLKRSAIKIYRTDERAEITISVNSQGKSWIKSIY